MDRTYIIRGIYPGRLRLAVGLPFSNYGRDKPVLVDFYMRQSRLEFSYEEEDYSVEIGKAITIEKAMVKWMKEIQREMKVQTGKDIPEHEVMKTALKECSNLPGAYAELIRGMLREKMQSLELELAERGYSMDYINIIYVGGGALLARDYAGKYRSHTAYDCDLCANAKGYEFLARQIEGRQVA